MSPRRKIPHARLPEIVARRAAGETLVSIGRSFGVSHVAIHYALRDAKRKRCAHCGALLRPRSAT